MEDQLTYLFRMAELSLEACEEGYGDDEEMQEKCEKKETRKMCYMYESMRLSLGFLHSLRQT